MIIWARSQLGKSRDSKVPASVSEVVCTVASLAQLLEQGLLSSVPSLEAASRASIHILVLSWAFVVSGPLRTKGPFLPLPLGGCRVMEQKEVPNGFRDEACGKETPAGYAGLCQ